MSIETILANSTTNDFEFAIICFHRELKITLQVNLSSEQIRQFLHHIKKFEVIPKHIDSIQSIKK